MNDRYVVEYSDSPTYYPEDQNRLPSTIDLVITDAQFNYDELL